MINPSCSLIVRDAYFYDIQSAYPQILGQQFYDFKDIDLENKTELDSKQITEKEVKKEATAMFSIEYLQNILKGATPESDIELNIKTNAPLKVRYKISNALLEFFLAPRDYE